ncbi:MAG: tripartite tricarboxylate transporter TctB family protein [Microbacterium sp.]
MIWPDWWVMMSHLTGDSLTKSIRTFGSGHWTKRGFKFANLIGSGVCVVFAVLILLGAKGYAFQVQNLPGPGMYPVVVGTGLLGLSVAWFVGTLLNRYPVDDEVEPPPDRSAFIRAMASFGVVTASAFAMVPLGYPITMAIAVLALVLLSGGRWRAAIISGLLFAVASFLLVTTVLGVQLPTGVLRPLLVTLL